MRAVRAFIRFGVPDQAAPNPPTIVGQPYSSQLASALVRAASRVIDDPGARLPHLREFSELSAWIDADTTSNGEGVLSRTPIDTVRVPVVHLTSARVSGMNDLPPYPESMRMTQNEGQVVLLFTLMANGRVDLASVRILNATNLEFVRAVREKMASWRYVPPMADGCPFSQLVQQPFTFKMLPKE